MGTESSYSSSNTQLIVLPTCMDSGVVLAFELSDKSV